MTRERVISKRAAKVGCNKKSFLLLILLISYQLHAQDVNLKIHLSGVYSSKISLMPLSGSGALKPFIEKPGTKNGETAVMSVPKDKLPGQFVLRFDYQETASANPYPSEKYIYINDQDLELWVKPKAVNNPDSTYFQKGEKENTLFVNFAQENGKQKAQLSLLQSFLTAYDQPESKFYQSGQTEYGNRREQYNQWVTSQIRQHTEAFVSRTFQFQYVPPVTWKGSEQQRAYSIIDHYFDMIDFKDPLLAKTAELRDWMNNYVNMYGAMSTTVALRDSLFSLAGKRAIERAKGGHPLVYGWMVDYFYKGYEGFNIAAGIKMLEPYMQDPRCLTSKRLEIEKRLQGIENIRPGTIAPDFLVTDQTGKSVQLHNYKTSAKYKLILFWSADCSHCKDMMKELYPWYEQNGMKKQLDVFAVSLDFTDTEIKVWEAAKKDLPDWKHSRPEGGINSAEANAYYVLSTPVMIMVDAVSNKIIALPETTRQLEDAIKDVQSKH